MASFMGRRLIQTIIVILGVTFISFLLLFLSGDPTYLLLGDISGLTEEQINQFRTDMGFDRPWLIQYLDYLTDLIRGNLGRSFYHGITNTELIRSYLPATIELALSALLIVVIVSVPLGVIAASNRGKIVDQFSMIFALFGQSVPQFWLGLMLMLFFSVFLRWTPVSGRGSLMHLILPAVTLASFPLARNTRLIRSCLLEVLGKDYIRTARSKGLSERFVLFKHAMRNSMIPVITMLGLEMGFMIAGAIIVEMIFAWPGIGRLIVQAVYTRDIPLVQSGVVVLAFIFVSINFLVDIIYAFLDPRIRYS